MNDISRGTPRAKIINYLLSPDGGDLHDITPTKPGPEVIFGIVMANSRLDDDLSVVATIEISNTPAPGPRAMGVSKENGLWSTLARSRHKCDRRAGADGIHENGYERRFEHHLR